jgi:M6 family metalloprotease-like protein
LKKIFFLFAFLFFSSRVVAAPMNDVPITLSQPDGTTLNAFASGDEFFNYVHDSAGRIIKQNPHTGFWTYAEFENEILVASERVATDEIFAFELFGATAREINFEKNKNLIRRTPDENSYANNFVSGTIENIIVLITFACDPDPTISTALKNQIESRFNGDEFSLRDYMSVASGGVVTVNSTLLGMNNNTLIMYRDDQPRAYFQPYNAVTNPIGYEQGGVGEIDEGHERGQKMLARAIRALDGSSLLDGKILDTIREGIADSTTFIISGSPGAWASFLWPHKWNLYMDTASLNGKKIDEYSLLLSGTEFSMSRSVIIHEQKHIFGAPDFYRYSSPTRIGSAGTPVGLWDIMSNNSDSYFQFSNTHVTRRYFGWGNPPEIISSDGKFSLHPLGTKNEITAYAIPIKNRPHEFILLEYRSGKNPTIYDNFPETGWYGSGLTVSRVNLFFTGNARSGDHGFQDGSNDFRDEVYVFRPNTTVRNAALSDISQASLGTARTAFGNANGTGYANIIYSQEGFNTGIEIYDVSRAEGRISFGVRLGESNIPPPSPEMILRAQFATAGNEPKIIFLHEDIVLNETFAISVPSGANITLRSACDEPRTISANGSHAVFLVHPNARFTVENIKITREPETVGSGIINHGELILLGGEISNHEVGIKMSLENLRTAGKIFVGENVIFANNHAEAAHHRAPEDDEIYRAQIFATRWSDPFSQGFNNFDIAYEEGEEATVREIIFVAHENFAPIRAFAGAPILSAPLFPKNPTRAGNILEWFFDENFTQPICENSTMPDESISIFARRIRRLGAIIDGENVSSADATFLARHLARHVGFELNEDKKIAADLNGDGIVCEEDLEILVLWLVGYDMMTSFLQASNSATSK